MLEGQAWRRPVYTESICCKLGGVMPTGEVMISPRFVYTLTFDLSITVFDRGIAIQRYTEDAQQCNSLVTETFIGCDVLVDSVALTLQKASCERW